MRRAIVSVEDRRFWTDPGSTCAASRARSLADATGGSREGASTIAEQFVKNALSQQDNRTIFEKLREAALAYHLTRRWPRTKIINEYLNSIYFGNGAYGVESAARVYFGKRHGYDSATRHRLAGRGLRGLAAADVRVTAHVLRGGAARRHGRRPERVRPPAPPAAAKGRRNLVLKDMLEQHYISEQQYQVRDRRGASDAVSGPAASGAGRGAVLHELAASADPRRDGPAPGRARQRR